MQNIYFVSHTNTDSKRYTEAFSDLQHPYADGPFPFAVGLTNTYRVETLNITRTGQIQSFLSQGGQRWQTIRLLTSGSVTFGKVGFLPTITPIKIDDLPSEFTSSNKRYNEIWKLGARAVSAACFSADAYKSIWDISPESGALVRGSHSGLSTRANTFGNYTLIFLTKIRRGGAGWSMAYGVSSRFGGIQLNLVGNYPEATTFANVNRTLLPPNSIVLGYGYDFVNQTTLTSYYLDVFEIPFSIVEGKWYAVSATMTGENGLSVSINGSHIFDVSLDDYYTGTSGSITTGSFGFGGYQDQSAYFKDVSVISSNATILYTNPMTDASVVLPEFGVHANFETVCLDGPKRDRLVWLGDFYHTAGIIGISTSRSDHITGTLQNFIDWQLPTGQLPLQVPLGYPSVDTTIFASHGPNGLFYGLADYHILGILSFDMYMRRYNDLAFATKNWPQWKMTMSWLTQQIDNSTGLVDVTQYGAFLGPGNGTAVNSAAVEAYRSMAAIAIAVDDGESADSWNSLADSLTANVQSKLWNSHLGVFSDSSADPTSYSVAGLSFAITSGVATASQARSCISALAKLKLSPGYKDSTSVNSSSTVNISPNTNGFLLNALMRSNATTETKYLLDNLWGAMIANASTTSGASWEYVDTNLQPGLSRYTSLSHPWGGAATYVLTEYIAGIRLVTFGYKTWVIEPAYTGFGLSSAAAKVQTPHGTLSVKWTVKNGKIKAVIRSPAGTEGQFVLNRALSNSTMPNTVVDLKGGSTKTISLDL